MLGFSEASFRQACTSIVRDLDIQRVGNDEDDIELVRWYLRSREAGPWLYVVADAGDFDLVEQQRTRSIFQTLSGQQLSPGTLCLCNIWMRGMSPSLRVHSASQIMAIEETPWKYWKRKSNGANFAISKSIKWSNSRPKTLFYSDDTLAEDRARMRSPQYQKHTGTGIRQTVTAARIVVERGTPSLSNI